MSRIPSRENRYSEEKREMRQRTKALENAPRIGNTTLENGELRVAQSSSIVVEEGSNIRCLARNSSTGEEFDLLMVGTDPNLPLQFRTSGFTLRRSDGSTLMFSGNDNIGQPVFVITDTQDNQIISSDPEGFGLATPHIPVMFYPPPTATISSATFVTVSQNTYFNQQSTLYGTINISSSSGGIGEVQLLLDDGVNPTYPIWSATIPASPSTSDLPLTASMPESYGLFQLKLQVRRTNGTGLVGSAVMNCYGGASQGFF